MDVGKRGFGFEDLVRKIEEEYVRKGYTREEAREIALKTAGKVFWRKFGPLGGRVISRALRKKYGR